MAGLDTAALRLEDEVVLDVYSSHLITGGGCRACSGSS